MRRFIASVVFVLTFATLCFGVNGNKARYAGGTESQIKDNAEGPLSMKDDKDFLFISGKTTLSVPYDEVNDLEYGQKAGRRVGLAIALTPLALLSKKRKHYLTLGWKDEKGEQHVAIFELGKHIVRTALATIEARTGRKIVYQDDEARKSGMGGEL